jgi:hypothetical protein
MDDGVQLVIGIAWLAILGMLAWGALSTVWHRLHPGRAPLSMRRQ